MTEAADELKAIRQLKARDCRFPGPKDVESWRDVFTADVVVTLHMAVSTGGAYPKTASPLTGVDNRLVANQEPAFDPDLPADDW